MSGSRRRVAGRRGRNELRGVGSTAALHLCNYFKPARRGRTNSSRLECRPRAWGQFHIATDRRL